MCPIFNTVRKRFGSKSYSVLYAGGYGREKSMLYASSYGCEKSNSWTSIAAGISTRIKKIKQLPKCPIPQLATRRARIFATGGAVAVPLVRITW